MKITQENVFGKERDYSRANRVLLLITLSTMQPDTTENYQVTQLQQDNSIQLGKHCDTSFEATKEPFHIRSVKLIFLYFILPLSCFQ